MTTAALPNWPARLSEDLAAAYCGVSKTTFRAKWQARRYPQPVKEGGRLFWSRVQLDQFVEVQFGLAENDMADASWSDMRG
jgi:predicted DNA-binding transcriptional regulator AlpA